VSSYSVTSHKRIDMLESGMENGLCASIGKYDSVSVHSMVLISFLSSDKEYTRRNNRNAHEDGCSMRLGSTSGT
jgi:hypothetical protein